MATPGLGAVVVSVRAGVPVKPEGKKADLGRDGAQMFTSTLISANSGEAVIVWSASKPSVAYTPGKRGQTNLIAHKTPNIPK